MKSKLFVSAAAIAVAFCAVGAMAAARVSVVRAPFNPYNVQRPVNYTVPAPKPRLTPSTPAGKPVTPVNVVRPPYTPPTRSPYVPPPAGPFSS